MIVTILYINFYYFIDHSYALKSHSPEPVQSSSFVNRLNSLATRVNSEFGKQMTPFMNVLDPNNKAVEAINRTLSEFSLSLPTPKHIAEYLKSGEASKPWDTFIKLLFSRDVLVRTIDAAGGGVDGLITLLGGNTANSNYLREKYKSSGGNTTKLADDILKNIDKAGGGIRGVVNLLKGDLTRVINAVGSLTNEIKTKELPSTDNIQTTKKVELTNNKNETSLNAFVKNNQIISMNH